jgi:tetrahydromethanopterin S-methyltransferase subunit G
MVPIGDEVERGLEVWRGEMNAKVAGIEKLDKRLDDLDERLDGLSTQVTTITAKASVWAAFGGLVGSGVVALVVAFGTKLIG